ncbi:MAG: helix-turn-helix transcriptional regulator [Pseudohongiellaceae bacterium]|nr:helix-turn-helix transcriptional regulator [Pseudohongiellaceae bacterium]
MTYVFYSQFKAKDFSLLDFYFNKKTEHRSRTLSPGFTFFLSEDTVQGITIRGERYSPDVLSCHPQYSEGHLVNDNNARMYSLNLPSERIQKVARSIITKNIIIDFPSQARLYQVPKTLAKKLRARFRWLTALLLNDIDSHTEYLAEKLIDEAIIPILIKVMTHSDYAIKKPDKASENFNLALTIIEARLDAPPSVKEIADELGITTRNLQSIFSKRVGASPKAYVKIRQLEKIHAELKTRPYYRGIISDVANEYGLWHLGQFSKDFKDQFGISPSELIKKHSQ